MRLTKGGGALALSQSNYLMSMYLGGGNGYGFFELFTTSVIRFLGAVFSKNTALIGGGGVYSSNSNAVMFNDTVMVSNYANISGGAIHFESQNIARLSRVTLLNNVAGLYGGAIQSHIANRIAFHNLSLFTENSAGLDGGAVAMTLGSVTVGR
jgi:predicted outer membrane repeat protein